MNSSHQTPLTLIFDLDGTLVDTAPDLTRSLNHVLSHIGRPVVPLSQVRTMVGQGGRAMIRAGTHATGQLITDGPEMDQLYGLFLDHYGQNICVDSRLFPGAIDCLNQYQSHGYHLGICTNKPEAMSKKLVNALTLTDYFSANLGGDSLSVKKPDPQHLLETIKRSGGEVNKAIMIGDSETDYLAARAAGVPVILVDFGYSTSDVYSLGADYVVSHFQDLPKAIADLRRSAF